MKIAKYHTFMDKHQNLWIVDTDDPTRTFDAYDDMKNPIPLLLLLLKHSPIKYLWSTNKEGEYV